MLLTASDASVPGDDILQRCNDEPWVWEVAGLDYLLPVTVNPFACGREKTDSRTILDSVSYCSAPENANSISVTESLNIFSRSGGGRFLMRRPSKR